MNNEYLFWLCFRNIYIRNQITKNILNDIYLNIKSINELMSHPLFNYIKTLELNINEPLEPYGKVIPFGVETLHFSNFDYHELRPNDIPSSVKTLSLSTYKKELQLNVIPNSVVNLYLEVFNKQFKQGVLPNSITKLELQSFNQPLLKDSLPNSIKHLIMQSFNQPLSIGHIPESVQILEMFAYNGNITIDSLPKLNLVQLNCGLANPRIQVGSLPSSIKTLKMQFQDQELVEGLIPNGVTSLTFGYDFNGEIYTYSIPQSVTYLKLSRLYNRLINPNSIPYTVKKLILPSSYYHEIPNSLSDRLDIDWFE